MIDKKVILLYMCAASYLFPREQQIVKGVPGDWQYKEIYSLVVAIIFATYLLWEILPFWGKKEKKIQQLLYQKINCNGFH